MNEDELGQALHRKLHALAGEIAPSQALMDAILDEPSRQSSVPGRWIKPRPLAAVVVTIAIVAVAVVVALSAGGSARAFAVIRHPDGSVTVTIRGLIGIRGANARLRELGIPAVVVPITAACPNHLPVSYTGVNERPVPTIRLVPREVAPGATVVLAARQVGTNLVEMALSKTTGRPPRCVSSRGVGPGLPAPDGRTPTPRRSRSRRAGSQ